MTQESYVPPTFEIQREAVNTTPVTICVTAEHIEAARRGREGVHNHDPIERALIDMGYVHPCASFYVATAMIRPGHPMFEPNKEVAKGGDSITAVFWLPEEAATFSTAFDEDKPVEAFSFVANLMI